MWKTDEELQKHEGETVNACVQCGGTTAGAKVFCTRCLNVGLEHTLALIERERQSPSDMFPASPRPRGKRNPPVALTS